MPTPRRPSARARLLDAADRLFYGHGIRAVGVETVVAEAGTAKTTLYGQFGSKDALVVAYLERRAAQARDRLDQALAGYSGPADRRILVVYDLLADELGEPGYRGSPFVNACVELGRDHPAAAVARGYRQWLLDTLARLAAEAGAPDPDALAAQLLQLYEAATVTVQSVGDGDAAGTARAAAVALLSAHLSAPTEPTDPPRRAQARSAAGAARLVGGGSREAHLLVAFLNTAHLPDSDDRLVDGRAGPWLAGWLTDARGTAPDGLDATTAAPTALLRLREGLRSLAAVNCGAEVDRDAVAAAVSVLARTPLLLDVKADGEPQLTAPDDNTWGLAVAVAAGAYLAVRARAEWPRLKVCASPECRWAFFDTTRNHSRRWCDMAGCGNRAKNRTWRDRHEVVTDKLG